MGKGKKSDQLTTLLMFTVLTTFPQIVARGVQSNSKTRLGFQPLESCDVSKINLLSSMDTVEEGEM